MREIVKANICDANNPDGVLTKDSTVYLECLKIEHEKLEKLLRLDKAHWKHNRQKVF